MLDERTTEQLDLRVAEHFPDSVHSDIAAGDDDLAAIPELTRQPGELREGA